jgi:NADPH:quinone reductase-like Zn-dependent oxidoreductase
MTAAAAPLNAAPLVHAATTTMQAMVQRQYGGPEVLALEEQPRPVVKAGEVLVRVLAAGVTVGDLHIITGKPYLVRLSPFGGLPRPRHPIPGALLAGRVESVGEGVTRFQPGDEVFGQAGSGAFAQYVALPAAHLAPKPSTLSFEEAATLPWAATALLALRGVKAGQRVLINGASGGVGTWAVQLAKAMGAQVTAVCSTRNVARLRALGADTVLDYTQQDFVEGGARFELVLDTVGNRTVADCLSVLVRGGTFVPCSGGGGDWFGPLFRMVAALVKAKLGGYRVNTFVMAPNTEDLRFLKELVESGKARPTVERTFPFSALPEALRHVGEGHAQGQTVVTMPAS